MTWLTQLSDLYEQLKPVSSASYNSKYAPHGCLEGTRTSVLKLLHDWSHKPFPEFGVFWLAGTVGTGKTTIAKTFCDQSAREGCLGATFFISRHDDSRRDPHNIIRTLAYDLAILNPSRAQTVWNELVSTPNMKSLRLHEQVSRLISRPSRIQQVFGLSTMIVIDALDESHEDSVDDDESFILRLVSALQHQAVKILVTSRDEPRISGVFRTMHHDVLKLHRMEQSDIFSDVRLFYETWFNQLTVSRGLDSTEWPSRTDLDILTERTGYLFVYAAIIVKFVGARRFSPVQQLRSILNSHHEPSQNHVVFQELDELYTHIIEAAVTINGVVNERLRYRVEVLIGTIIVLQHPLPFSSISGLLWTPDGKYDREELRSDFESLASVLPMPELDSDPVQIFHPSFPEYMQDPKRCRLHNVCIAPADAHLYVAIACLKIMNTSLRQDICNIQDFTLSNSDVVDLQQCLHRCVSEELRYACSYWITHLVFAPPNLTLVKELRNFCKRHIFHWIEVLSLLNKLNVAMMGLPRGSDWCRVS
jgi:hypothetical protein